MLPSSSLAMTGEHGKCHDVCAHEPEAVSDWFHPVSLGNKSASAYIGNLA